MSLPDIDTQAAAASAAIASGDYETALTHALRLQVLIAASPDMEQAGGRMGWSAGKAANYVADIRKALAASLMGATNGPIQRSKVTYAQVTD